jgi:hypothetical protein
LTQLAVIGERHVARFATVRAIIETICAKPDTVLAFTDGAVFFATARFFGLVTLDTDNLLIGRHSLLDRTLPERLAASKSESPTNSLSGRKGYASQSFDGTCFAC